MAGGFQPEEKHSFVECIHDRSSGDFQSSLTTISLTLSDYRLSGGLRLSHTR